MDVIGLDVSFDGPAIGREMHALIEEMYPICRSITGNGFRQTMEIIKRYVPIDVNEVPTGTKVFDWTVPREWNIRDAYVIDEHGRKAIDFQRSNLHVVSYSVPVDRTMSLEELRPHLFTLPDRPDWIPYKTSYYEETWGFCLRHRDLLALKDGKYHVLIDASLDDGFLTYGELFLQGAVDKEVLFSCHACHPSLCNDNLSGVALATLLARQLSLAERRYSYRFLFIPGTIGAITWLALNEKRVPDIKHGLVLTGVGDRGIVTYKRSRRGDAEIDRAVAHVLAHSGQRHQILDFDPYGYDERQYCSPGFNLPVGRLSRTPYGAYPEYHTSADNLDFVTPESLADSFRRVIEVLAVLEANRTFTNLNPKCEPQLGRRGLYTSVGTNERALLWVLNLSEGDRDLLEIADKSGMPFALVRGAAERLTDAGLLAVADSLETALDSKSEAGPDGELGEE